MVGLLLSSSDDVNLNDNGLFPTAKGKPQPGDPGQNVFSSEQLPVRDLQSRADKSIEHDIEDIEWPQDVKLDRVVESAWAILLSWYGGQPILFSMLRCQYQELNNFLDPQP